MFRKLSNSLTSPKEVAKYYRESFGKTILFFLILLFFMMIPIVIALITTDFLPYSTKEDIKDTFKDENIPFVIEDGILKHVDGLSEAIYINQEVKPYEIVFTEKIENYTVKMDEMVIIFTNDGVYLKMAFANAGIVNFSEHEYLKNLDFSDKTVLGSDDFWHNIFSITDKVLDSYKPIYIVGYGFYYLFYWFMWLAIFCLIMAFFSKMRTMGLIKFWELFKMSIYSLTPFVICAVFSSLFNLGFLVYIGYLISAIYNIITVNEIIKNNFATRKEG